MAGGGGSGPTVDSTGAEDAGDGIEGADCASSSWPGMLEPDPMVLHAIGKDAAAVFLY